MTEHVEAPDRAVEASSRLTRSAIKSHWDPATIDLEPDGTAVSELSRVEFTRLRGLLAQFGASEQSVTEDLGPLTVALENSADQRFVATQLYDEIRHAELFDRYWTEIVQPEERARGVPVTDPSDNRWHAEAHTELLDRTGDAMARLIDRDTATTRARAYAHYHLTVEGIFAQTAYEWIETRYGDRRKSITEGDQRSRERSEWEPASRSPRSDEGVSRNVLPGKSISEDEPASEIPVLPGLAEGIGQLRRDESRHVRFGVLKTRELLDSSGERHNGSVEPAVVCETVNELLPLVEETVERMVGVSDGSPNELLDRVVEWRDRRLEGIGARRKDR